MIYDVDSYDISSGGADEGEGLTKKEFEEFMYLATQQAKFQETAHMFNDTCWDICVKKPGTKLDNQTSMCLSNCVNRFVDATLYITTRYYNILQRNASRM